LLLINLQYYELHGRSFDYLQKKIPSISSFPVGLTVCHVYLRAPAHRGPRECAHLPCKSHCASRCDTLLPPTPPAQPCMPPPRAAATSWHQAVKEIWLLLPHH
jgi:hypothetical protein